MNSSYSSLQGDPGAALVRFMAECEGMREDATSCRELMSGLFDSKLYKEQSALWLDHVTLELRFGTVDNTRKIFQKAMQCSTDDPDLVLQKFLEFEVVHGTLESYDNTSLKCKRQQKRLDEKRARELQKQAANEKNSGKNTKQKKQETGKPDQNKNKKRKMSSEKSAQEPTKHHKPNTPDKTPDAPKFPRKQPAEPGAEVDKSRYHLTVFVSNLSYSATEDDLNITFR